MNTHNHAFNCFLLCLSTIVVKRFTKSHCRKFAATLSSAYVLILTQNAAGNQSLTQRHAQVCFALVETVS